VAGEDVQQSGWEGSLTSHNRAVVSWLEVARVRPSGLNAAEETPPIWPIRIPSAVGWWGSRTSHSRAVVSWLAVATVFPSGLKATQ
jgi:hypothetical protein